VTSDGSVSTRVARRLPELLHEVAAERSVADAAPIAELTVRTLVAGLDEGRLPTDDELADLREASVRRAQDGATLDAVIAGCHVGARITLGALADEADADGAPLLRSAGGALLRLLEHVTSAVAAAYLDEQQAIRTEERDARRALATALVAGDPVDAPAARLGVTVAPAYVAVALSVPPALTEGDAAVVARERLRSMQDRLEQFAGSDVLGLLDPTGGTALIPATPDRVGEILDSLPRLLDDIGAAIGTEAIAGAAACVGVVSVSRAARQARDVLGIARRLERPPGVYQLDDVLLEYQLTRDSDARPLLAGLLDPLEANPDLLHTLECYFERELDRRSTATALHVHPNTLDYRLRRISQLTGLDPGKQTGQQLLAAALTARRLV
jgi:hypothetical protein